MFAIPRIHLSLLVIGASWWCVAHCWDVWRPYRTKTMLPTRKSVPTSSRQLDHTKTSWPSWRDANYSGMDMSVVHQVWLKPSCNVQWKGGRRRGRQRKSLEDNIREWTGLEFANSQRAVENRENWRKLVVQSSVVPQRPSRLRDWWWWWWWPGWSLALKLYKKEALPFKFFKNLFFDGRFANQVYIKRHRALSLSLSVSPFLSVCLFLSLSLCMCVFLSFSHFAFVLFLQVNID